MEILQRTWSRFRDELNQYASRPRDRRLQWLFRGQADATWDLVTTLDRWRKFSSDKEREVINKQLLREFQEESLLLGDSRIADLRAEAIELFARHHGLPSPLIDFTQSPYVASYFAFENALKLSESVAVWAIDRAKLPITLDPSDLIDDRMLIRFNTRALGQKSVFLRVSTRNPLVSLLGSAVRKYELPFKDRSSALADLDEMGINATSLFADLDGIVRTVIARMSGPR